MIITDFRNDFPILQQCVYGKPLIYFDNAATTQKPIAVINKITELYKTQNANIHRGVHYLSQKATEAHEGARAVIAKFINAHSKDEVIFTRGTTESINLTASCFAKLCKQGDEIIISQMEHHSNIVPWQMVAEQYDLKINVLHIDSEGNLPLYEYEKLFNQRTKIVAVTHISNVLGTINPIKKMVQIAHNHGVAVVVDGAQAVAHTKVDVQALDADFYAFSGHKIYAPTGIGVLYAKREWLDKMPPYQGGGEMIRNVSFEKTTYNDLPYKFEAGTPDFISSVALQTAIEYIKYVGFDEIITYENELLLYATEKMKQINDMIIYGCAKDKSSVISFNIKGIHHLDLGTLLDKTGIAIRTGHHCAEPLVLSYGVGGMARASFAFYNTKAEIDVFIENLKKCIKILKG
jgi:cysteine desulfurase/selenocysteine lyase